MLKVSTIVKEETLARKAEQALLACLKEVPFLKVRQVKQDPHLSDFDNGGPDLIIRCQENKSQTTLLAEIKTSGQPRIAREAVNQLLLYSKNWPKSYPVFVAPYISQQAAEICTKNGIGYLDLAGNCYLNFEKVFIKKEGQSNPFGEKRDLRSLYSPRAERVLRVLLVEPKRTWKLNELAETSDISLGQAYNVKKLLADREWLEIRSDGFNLSNPKNLLEEWSKNYNFRRNQSHDFYSLESLSQIETALAALCKKDKILYAFTGFSGSARVMPSVRYQRAMAYVEANAIEKVAKELNLKKVGSGANLTLLEPYDSGVFYGKKIIDQSDVVSSIQLYLDLIGFRGRGEEAASTLFEERIEPQW